MKAAQITDYMPSKDVRVVSSAAEPVNTPSGVLVEVQAAALNPIDWKMVTGELKDWMQLPFPFTPASDFAGVVKEVGDGVEHLQVGDEVYGMAGFNREGSGSLAEVARAKAAFVWQKPKNLSFEQAAAVPMAGLRAWLVLHDILQLEPGQKFFMPGGAGGIGSFAIQIAKHLGAHVATSVSTKDIDFVKSLGADEVIDYTKEDFSQKLSGYDAVFDVIGGDTFADSFKILKPGGKMTTMLWQRRPDLVEQYHVQFLEQGESATPATFKALGALLEDGTVKIHVDKTFSFDKVGEALDHLQHGHPQGKVVVKIQE